MPKKPTSKKPAAKKNIKKKNTKKSVPDNVNPQITDIVTVTQTSQKVYKIETTPAIENTESKQADVLSNDDIKPSADNLIQELPAPEAASYSNISAPSDKDNTIFYIGAALGLALLTWLLVL
jgi:hypothetical protein